MTLTDRDRRILLIIIPVVVLIAYWFLLLSPKRQDLSTARDEQVAAEQQRDAAVALETQLKRARDSFASDYAAVVRLGKAIPAQIDAPSLLVQLDRAAEGTHIDLDSVTFGARTVATLPATTTTSTGATGATGTTGPAGAAAAGGAPAQTQPGQQAEAAGNAANQATQAGQAAATDTTVTTTAGATPAATPAPAGLEQVPVTFNFTGSYFDLADFFHRLKRFVFVANNQIFVRGRLIRIESVTFAPGAAATGATGIGATVVASVFLSPKAQGVTGGATPAGPATATPAPGQSAGRPVVPTEATAGVR